MKCPKCNKELELIDSIDEDFYDHDHMCMYWVAECLECNKSFIVREFWSLEGSELWKELKEDSVLFLLFLFRTCYVRN